MPRSQVPATGRDSRLYVTRPTHERTTGFAPLVVTFWSPSMRHALLPLSAFFFLACGSSASTDGDPCATTTCLPDLDSGSGPPVDSSVATDSRAAAETSSDTSVTPADADAATDAGSAKSPWVPTGYTLVFGDEFDEAELDTSKWWTRYVYSDGTLDRLNDEQQRYRENENHVMTGSELQLTGRKVSSGGDGINYESGMIRSKTLIKYGYLEARVKMPPGVGSWPAFWLNAEVSPWPPEIDIFEFVNNGVEDTADMLHTGVIDHGAQGHDFLSTDPAFHTDWTYWKAPFEFPADFHVIALLWDATSASTYVDGKLIVKRGYKWVHDDGSDAGYAHVLLDYAIGGASWAGRHGIDDTKFPQSLEVDYVRVYQSKVDTAKSTIGRDLCPKSGC